MNRGTSIVTLFTAMLLGMSLFLLHASQPYVTAAEADGHLASVNRASDVSSIQMADHPVYIFSSGDADTDQRMVDVISAAGYVPTLGIEPGAFTGSEVDLTQFKAVVAQNSYNWAESRMDDDGQMSLVNFVQNGGGLITAEWFVYHMGSSNTSTPLASILPVTWSTWTSTVTTTYTVDIPNPVINAGLPDQFTFSLQSIGGTEILLLPKQGALSFYTTSGAGGSGLVGWDMAQGRVASFSNLLTNTELQDEHIAKLLGNTLDWVSQERFRVYVPTVSGN